MASLVCLWVTQPFRKVTWSLISEKVVCVVCINNNYLQNKTNYFVSIKSQFFRDQWYFLNPLWSGYGEQAARWGNISNIAGAGSDQDRPWRSCLSSWWDCQLGFSDNSCSWKVEKQSSTIWTGHIITIPLVYMWGDAHFYWTHRLLHTPWLYKRFATDLKILAKSRYLVMTSKLLLIDLVHILSR